MRPARPRRRASRALAPSGPMLDSRARRDPLPTRPPIAVSPAPGVRLRHSQHRLSDRMSDDVQHPGHGREPDAPIPFKQPRRRRRRGRSGKPKLRKLRVMSILIGFGALAIVSTVFGMMMAVASDIPQIENEQQYKHKLANSFLYDDHWRPIGLLAPPNN